MEFPAELYDFLDLMTTPLKSKILPIKQKLSERKYKRIILVAHSLGAVLVRQAQLFAVIAKKKWVNHSSMVLFAPAHSGANVIPLAMQALPGLSSLLGVFAKFKYPILNDLDPTEDGILNSIETRTDTLQKSGKGEFTKAVLVVHVKGDKIVKNQQYLLDSPPKIIQNSTHISICKPNDAYSKPLELLKAII